MEITAHSAITVLRECVIEEANAVTKTVGPHLFAVFMNSPAHGFFSKLFAENSFISRFFSIFKIFGSKISVWETEIHRCNATLTRHWLTTAK